MMRKGEATIVEMARLEKYLQLDEVEILNPNEEALDEVSDILKTYTEEEVRKIDNTAAAYYQWVSCLTMVESYILKTLGFRLHTEQDIRNIKNTAVANSRG